MAQGYLAMVLHAHLPFVWHEASEQALEERWLFEALSETYLPLLAVWERLRERKVPFAFALTISPTLLTLLTDREMAARYVAYLQKTIELSERELMRTVHEPDVHPLARMYRARFAELLRQYESYGRNVVARFVSLADSGHLELLTCGATHGFLPALATEESRRAQVALAVETHLRLTGRCPRGIWLPECGYVPGIEQVLEQAGLAYFLVDSHAFDEASVPGSVYAPLRVGTSQVYALARDPEAARQVWSSFVGYPGDPEYREYYRDIGFDLDWSYMQEFVHPEGIRVNTGIKYYRVTGAGLHKEFYRPDRAERKCVEHAAHFTESRVAKVREIAEALAKGANPPLVVAPYDAELFGHWWFEGPQWLEQVVLHLQESDVRMITPGAYLAQYPQAQRATLSMSSWGRGGYADVWVNEANDWLYPHLHRLEERLVGLIRRKLQEGMDELTELALRQMAREVLLAEASDWAFIMTMGTTVQYAVRRTREHLERAWALAETIEQGAVEWSLVKALEAASPIFPHLRLEDFVAGKWGASSEGADARLRVLMLAWEFPPRTVGGLARHVYDLSRALVEQGVEVHVVTCHGEETPEHEVVDGVQVHRVWAPDYAAGDDFVRWSMLLNVRLAAMGNRVLNAYGPFAVVHAHDWLVAESAQLLAEQGGAALVATIHATEHGRNHGLHSELQRQIAHIEWKLADQAREVIVCSDYMLQEMRTVYGVPEWKQHVLANGVELAELWRGVDEVDSCGGDAATVFFVGRLVREKGVHVLMEAAPAVLEAVPHARFKIAGKGPMLEALRRQAEELGVAESVEFMGFVSDEERNREIRRADVAVFPSLYEPFGIVALEAMGLGTATVVSRTGGLAEIVEHELDGWCVEPGDAGSLAETLIGVLQRREASARVARRGQVKVIERFGWAAIARGTVQVYEQALHGKVAETSDTGAPHTKKHPSFLRRYGGITNESCNPSWR